MRAGGLETLFIAVVGLGKIGLPLAAQYASKGHTVVGCDVDPAVVDAVNAGLSHVLEEPGLQDRVGSAVADGRLRATLDTAAAVRAAAVVVIVVPLLVDSNRNVDFASLDAALRSVARGLHAGTLVVVETTLPVGTTRGRVAALLSEGSGLQPGVDFSLAFSPERVYSGRIFEDLRRYPKVVGGIDSASGEKASDFYRSVLDADVLQVTSVETAEFIKLAETTYRDVNFALANQLALYAGSRGVDAQEAFSVANSQPFSHLHAPNIGIGGHCIPVYPYFLLQDSVGGELEMLRIARATNDGMAAAAVNQLGSALEGLAHRRVLILGVAYRENVKELSFSVALRLKDLLYRAGACVLAHDPLFSYAELAQLGVEVVTLDQPVDVDAVIIQAYHREYDDLDWTRFRGLRVVLDGRGNLDPGRFGGTEVRYLRIAGPTTQRPGAFSRVDGPIPGRG
jgi:nucleotide sugar dehydrogenase